MTGTTDTTRWKITKPGIYDGMPAEVYHRDPVPYGSLSSSGARLLLPPDGCPAKFEYARTHPEPPKKHFDLGNAAHHLVLGVGPQPVEIDFADMRTNAAKDAAKEARERGQIPLLPDQMATVQDMAAVLMDHPATAPLFAPGTGKAEQSLFWAEPFTWRSPRQPLGEMAHQRRLWRRARLDWLSHQRLADGRLIIPDYKTAVSAEPTQFMKAVVQHGYHQQAVWYTDAVRGVGLVGKEEDREAAFLFVVQEKKPPYVVSVIELPPEALMWGRELNTESMIRYSEACLTGHWGGYSDKIEMPSLPAYAQYQYEEIVNSD